MRFLLIVIVCEYGRWDMRSKVREGATEAANVEAYLEQASQTFLSVAREFEDDGGLTVLYDFEGFNYLMITDLQSKGSICFLIHAVK